MPIRLRKCLGKQKSGEIFGGEVMNMKLSVNSNKEIKRTVYDYVSSKS